MSTCTCGHDLEEHKGDPNYPATTVCQIDGCDCTFFEEYEDDEDDSEDD